MRGGVETEGAVEKGLFMILFDWRFEVEKLGLNAGCFGEVGTGEVDTPGESFPLVLLFSTVLTVTVVPAGMFLVSVSALFAASDIELGGVIKLFL